MPSRKGTEQALTWLRSKALEKDSLDGINAEVCLNVIADLQRQNNQKGCVINRMKSTLKEETVSGYRPSSRDYDEAWS